MFHRTFNPGPSQISDAVKADIVKASEQNILSISHRSSEFIEITQQAINGLRQYFSVPTDYHVLFASSATEALELTVRNLVQNESFHFTNGHFSELSTRISESYGNKVTTNTVIWGKLNDFYETIIPKTADLIMLNYNETSTGATCDNESVITLHESNPDKLLAVDITSVAGCLPIEISKADVWLFSVQKGFGLPSGLGVMFLSPKALEHSRKLRGVGLFNFDTMSSYMINYQTIHTPNVLAIYLLAKQLKRWNKTGVSTNEKETLVKAKMLERFIEAHSQLSYLVEEPKARSKTTICLSAEPEVITKLHKAALKSNLVLGSGYGKLKPFTIRVANFPALERTDIRLLINSLGSVL